MEYVTVEFYFDDTKRNEEIINAKNSIMSLFEQKDICCIENTNNSLVYRDDELKTGKVCWVLNRIADDKTLVNVLKEAYLDVDDREDVLNGFLRIAI